MYGLDSSLTRLRGLVSKAARARGYEIKRVAPPTEARRIRRAAVDEFGISVVLDVGANDGGFARELRADGYCGRIISLEPTSDAFAQLQTQCRLDPLWDCRNVAIAAVEGERTINVAANSSSSSLLPMSEQHALSAPRSVYVKSETVNVLQLDTVYASLELHDEPVFLKIDVQGSELAVLTGSEQALPDIAVIECELSFWPLYEGQALFWEVVEWMRARGFVLTSIEAVHFDIRTGELLQINGLFLRPAARI